jgi:hypothetical protein
MQNLRFRRASTGAAVLAGVALVATLLPAGPASAAAKAVTCTSLSGNLSTTPITFILGGCTGNTGGGGKAQGETITWANGQTTYLTTAAFPVPATRARRGNCPALSDKYVISDLIYQDSTGSIKAPGKISAEVCIQNEAPDPWSLAPGSLFKLR